MTQAIRSRRVLLTTMVAAALGALIVVMPSAIALLAPATLGVLVLVLLVRVLFRGTEGVLDSRRILWWTMVVFASHLLFGLIATSAVTPFTFLRSDAGTYHTGATMIMKHWSSGLPLPVLAGGKEGFYYTLAGLYWVFGAHAVAGLALNATLAAALVPVLTDLTHRLFGAEAARRVAPLVVFLPGIFVWTSPLFKEAGVALLVAVAISCAARITDRASFAALLGFAVSLSVLFTYRGPFALVLTGGLVIGIVLASRQLFSGVGVAFVAAVLLSLFVLALGIGLSGYRSATEANLERANVVRQDLARSAASGIQPDVDISTPGRAVSYLPIGLVNFGLGPFPWQINTSSQLVGLLDAVVWWALLPSLWRGWRAAKGGTGRPRLLLTAPAVLACVVLALSIGNFGTIVRERVQVVVILIPFIALGLAKRAERTSAPTDTAPVLVGSRA